MKEFCNTLELKVEVGKIKVHILLRFSAKLWTV